MDKVKQTSLQLFNTASREKEIFKPMVADTVKMYTCGPTVYNFAHIGNFRAYVFEDLLRRTLKFFGYKVIQVMNLTDVDDKTIKGAIAENVTLNEFTQTFKDAFFADLKSLNVEPAEHYPAATDYIAPMIEVIEKLQEKGIAYQGKDGSIYFAISKFPRYGCLSHLNLDELKVGASERVDNDEYEKDNVADFVLWKAYEPKRDGKIYWESPFGPGRPGWHLECSTMAMKILGETIDIHVGGIDNMFPHHENEIAQSEAYSERHFVNLWMHCDHLIFDGKKMSKSLGNVYTPRDLIAKGFSGIHLRYMLLQTHYKTQLNFTLAGLEAVKNSLQRLQDFIARLKNIQSSSSSHKVSPLLAKASTSFTEALADDLNISVALAVLFELVREINILCDSEEISSEEAEAILSTLKHFNQVLGILSFDDQEIPQEITKLFELRLAARKNHNWQEADILRDAILSKGFVIEDSPSGARLKKKNA